jgi:hypothetical protein
VRSYRGSEVCTSVVLLRAVLVSRVLLIFQDAV